MYKKIEKEELKLILENHAKYLANNGGCCADLSNADLRGADLREADLTEADLTESNLITANLWKANLRGAKLTGADLTGANLRRADLTRANLQGAKLWYTNLQGTNLEEANLWGANLWGANLAWANLDGTKLTNAKLNNTIGNCKHIFNIFTDSWNIVYTSEIMAIGCKSYTIDEWLNFKDYQILIMHPDALEWWKKWKPIIVQFLEANGIKHVNKN